MTRLGYLLPFLWALGCGADTTALTPTATTPNLLTSKVTPAETTVTPTVSQPSPTVSTAAATTPATTKPPTTQVPSVTAVTTKLPTTESRGSQTEVQPATVKTETTSVTATSSEPNLGTKNGNIPNVTSSSDKSIQPTDPPKASTPVLKSSTVEVTSPNITENTKLTTPLSATSPTFSRTSESSTEKSVTNHSSTGTSSSTVSPSPVTISKTTARDSTTSVPKETTPLVIPIQKKLENIEINCTTEIKGSLVKINIKPSSICGEYTGKNEDEAKEILKHICTALKPGYKPDQEKCHIDLGSGPTELVIVKAYVQSSLSPDDLYASLKHIKKDGSYLFNYGAKYEDEDSVSIPLISAIVSLAVALLIAAAIYGCWHQRQTRKREQRLTEELQTMENGYHDNPTLEVMETSPEMQEKKGGPNGELGDSWIVPLDNLTREDFDEEEDTHL